MSALKGKSIVLGLTGGIAVYKSASLLRRLTRDIGCDVTVVMTQSAQAFMSPLIFETFSGKEVITDMFTARTGIVGTRHIDIIQRADLVAVIPASANIIGKIAGGIADDALSTMLLVARPEKIVIAPAMNKNMYLNPHVQRNLQLLRDLRYHVIEPGTGELATGEEGWGVGRLPDERTLLFYLEQALLSQTPDPLRGKRVLITGGPTREAIDDIRYISNPSSGKMGHALAESAAKRGAAVTYVSGPSSLPDPLGCTTRRVNGAADMKVAVTETFDDADIVVMAAAVEDIKPRTVHAGKIKKTGLPARLELETNDDILLYLGKHKTHQTLIGFSVEVENELENSLAKMEAKHLDGIVINNPREAGSAFAGDTNRVTLLLRGRQPLALPLLSKTETAEAIWDRLAGTL
ncbi:MAG: bifunctional phosphopantothenoylcysteine decarboxylase/phosphopantothenate--cysteine ligase CoaBC [Candidatus Marinimicrobia bacterium]|nr:bifunctional phosphopantothenoylcysteine decarboxylase/phosphopantothenate--cysteine ligase CoaBC [Candidatus Neomarinimicrobiota bacterium]